MTVDGDPDGRLEALAAHVERRISELGLEYAAVARTAGFSDETLSKIRKGIKARAATYRKLERALRWEAGSVQAVLDGGAPISAAEAESGDSPGVAETRLSPDGEMVRRVVRATAREWGLKPQEMDEVLRLVRQDLERMQHNGDDTEDPGNSRAG